MLVSVLLFRDNELLLLHRGAKSERLPTFWDVPNGQTERRRKKEPQEKAAHAIRRVIMDDIGVEVTNLRVLWRRKRPKGVVFKAVIPPSESIRLGDGFDDYRWVNPYSISMADLDIVHRVREAINWHLSHLGKAVRWRQTSSNGFCISWIELRSISDHLQNDIDAQAILKKWKNGHQVEPPILNMEGDSLSLDDIDRQKLIAAHRLGKTWVPVRVHMEMVPAIMEVVPLRQADGKVRKRKKTYSRAY